MSTSLNRLLKSTSRSFYLTLRLLPGSIRQPISLAYLLARASDSIADAAGVSIPLRLEILHRLANINLNPCIHFPKELLGKLIDSERKLMEALPQILLLANQSFEQESIFHVWQTILKGQEFDLVRFDGTSIAPLSSEERLQYIYWVAGCVGEFWTDICSRQVIPFAKRPLAEMKDLGRAYGCGLQLVNILRDQHKDAQNGRFYVKPSDMSRVLSEASQYLSQAEEYVVALEWGRLRYACALPVCFGKSTLDLIEQNPNAHHVRISRRTVYQQMITCLPIWYSSKAKKLL